MSAPAVDTIEPGTAYPPGLDDLLPQARALAEEMGELPSRNYLMRRLKIGAPKASALRDILAGETQSEPARDPVSLAKPGGSEAGPDPDESPTTPPQVKAIGHPAPTATPTSRRSVPVWPLIVLAAPAFVAIWSGWVGLGGLTGFGQVRPLPGIADDFTINSAITLPIGVETYAAYALRAWLTPVPVPARARRFARWSAIGSLILGAGGQVAYHVMVAAGVAAAPWWITTLVACLPVAVLGMGTALAHLLRQESPE